MPQTTATSLAGRLEPGLASDMPSVGSLCVRARTGKYAITTAWHAALDAFYQSRQLQSVLDLDAMSHVLTEVVVGMATFAQRQSGDKAPTKCAAEHGQLCALAKNFSLVDLRQEYALLRQALSDTLGQQALLSSAERRRISAAVRRSQQRALACFTQVQKSQQDLTRLDLRLKRSGHGCDRNILCRSRGMYLVQQLKLQRRLIDLLQAKALPGPAPALCAPVFNFIDKISCAMFVTDSLGAAVFVNARWRAHTGLTAAESLDHGWHKALRPSARAKILARLAQICSSKKKSQKFECELRGARGPYRWHIIHMWYIALPPERGSPAVWLAAAHDIHGARRAETQMQQRLQRLRAAQQQSQKGVRSLKNEALLQERFVALLAHDLRNPLSVAQMCCHKLQHHADAPAETRESTIQRLLAALSRTDGMIGNLLDAYRLQRGGKFSLCCESMDMCAAAAASIAHQAEHDSQRFVLQSDLPQVHGLWDANQLSRVFDNLYVNAVKYSAPQTPIVVGITSTPQDVTVSVHNEGEPIAQNLHQKIFAPFERVAKQKNTTTGWGLGLALVRGIVEAHQGNVWVESRRGAGTTFVVRLPRAPNESIAARPKKLSVSGFRSPGTGQDGALPPANVAEENLGRKF